MWKNVDAMLIHHLERRSQKETGLLLHSGTIQTFIKPETSSTLFFNIGLLDGISFIKFLGGRFSRCQSTNRSKIVFGKRELSNGENYADIKKVRFVCFCVVFSPLFCLPQSCFLLLVLKDYQAS